MKKAFFIDRDGVLNVEVDYLGDPEKMELLPRVPEAVKLLHKAGYLAVVITNQAGIAKGYYSLENMFQVHTRMQHELLKYGQDALLDAFYHCPHHPDFTGICQCRKPGTLMLEKAAAAFDIDLKSSFMTGDRMSDLYAGRNAGCKESCLVYTGYGRKNADAARQEGFPAADNFYEAVKMLLEKR